MTNEQILAARSIAPLVGQSVAAVDTDPLFVIQYVPDRGTGGTAATISVNGLTLTFTVDSAVPKGDDVIGNATGQVLLTTYDSFGELVDYVNGRKAWRMYLTGGTLRSTSTKRACLAAAAASCIGDNGKTVLNDSSATKFVGFSISAEKFVNNGVSGHVTDADSMAENGMWGGSFEATFNGTGALQVYTSTQKGGTGCDTLIHTQTATTSTAITAYTPQGAGPYFKAELGERLIIRILATSTFASVIGFTLLGKSAVLDGSRIVNDDNW